jgi:hypothetical protein
MGHDSVNTILAYVFYDLSLCPAAIAAVPIELGSLLGTDASPEGRAGESPLT